METRALLQSESVLIWGTVINVTLGVSFIIGGFFRWKALQDVSQRPIFFRNFSRLQKLKMLGFAFLLGTDSAVCTISMLQEAERFENVIVCEEQTNSQLIVSSFIISQILITVATILAALLRHDEYMRDLSEVWYTHKLYLHGNLLLHIVFIAIFFPYFSYVFIVLEVSRDIILLNLIFCLLATKRRGRSSRITVQNAAPLIRKVSWLEEPIRTDAQTKVSVHC